MTISTMARKAGPFIGNGSQTVFPFTFLVFSAADVLVVRSTGDVQATLTLPADYTVTLNSDQTASPGGNVTLLAPLALGSAVTIGSQVDARQDSSLTNGGGFFPKVIERALDRLTILIQQLKEQSGRALTLPLSAPSDISTALPLPDANKLIGWDATAKALQNMDPTVLATIVAFGTATPDVFDGDGTRTDFTLSGNPGALGNLDVSIAGITQTPGIDFTLVSGTTLRFVTAPAAGFKVLARYLRGLPQGITDSGASTYSDGAIYAEGSVGRAIQLLRLAMQTGASEVGWKRAVGGVDRTVAQELENQPITPEQFGAGGLGLTNDTAAIQEAIAACAAKGGGEVHLNGKIYRHTGLTMVDGVSLIGRGAGVRPNAAIYSGTVLLNTAATNSITAGDDVNDLRSVRLENLRITSTGSALIGVRGRMWGNLDAMVGCMVDNHVTGGVELVNCWSLLIKHCWIGNNTGYGIKAGNATNNCVLSHVSLFQNGGDGLQIEATYGLIVDAVDCEGNFGNQIHVIGGSNRGLVIGGGGYIEHTASSALGFAAIKFDPDVCDTADIGPLFWDCSNAASGLPVTYLDVGSGNTRIRSHGLSFVNGATPQYATFVNFRTGSDRCRAQVALTANPVVNNSPSSRVYYDDEDEIGASANNPATQAIPATTWAALLFPTEAYDPKGELGTGSVFTPRDHGLYEIEFAVSIAATAGDTFTVRAFDGSVELAKLIQVASTTATQTISGRFVEKLSPAQAVQIQIYASAARSTNPGGANYSWLRAKRIG